MLSINNYQKNIHYMYKYITQWNLELKSDEQYKYFVTKFNIKFYKLYLTRIISNIKKHTTLLP